MNRYLVFKISLLALFCYVCSVRFGLRVNIFALIVGYLEVSVKLCVCTDQIKAKVEKKIEESLKARVCSWNR